VEREVLYLLTGMSGPQQLWSMPELGREVEHADAAQVAVNSLRRAGLVHQTTDGFVFASRAGVRIVQLVGHVV
jgi:hypothetical protein